MKIMETAYFAGGCFWCITPTFREKEGVLDVISGYSGGPEINPVYEDVKNQKTGHRETIRIDYDPSKVSFRELFNIFLVGVDPFDVGGQFIDRGFSYTLAVYYLSEEQKQIAEDRIQKLERTSGKQVFISVEPFRNFYAAEDYHQNYDLKNPEAFEKELIESGRKKILGIFMKTIYRNAAVYTGTLPLQEAFGVEDDQFFFVGTNQEAAAQSADRLVDLQGAFVCAGFNDSHMHLLNFGRALTTAPLHKHTDSLENLLRCLKSAGPGMGGWILGRGWNQDYFSDVRRMPNRWDLDRVSTQYPVCAIRACGHALAVNSKALELLDITADTPQPEGGQILLENGVPNGLFFDNAMALVYDAFPAPSKADLKNMILAACAGLNAYGITSVQSDDYCVFRNAPWQEVNNAFRELEEAGELTVRVYEQANFTNVTALQEFIAKGNITGSGTNLFRIGPLKMLGDGALGARTAYLTKPYADDPATRGLSVFSQQDFDELISCANAAGMQCAIHCIGDACLDMVLSSFERALAAHPRKDHRHGIVHCQITRPDQLQKIADLGLHVYAQSIFLDYDIHMVKDRVGEELSNTSYSWKTLKNLGATVSNGSDCPVELPDVLAGIQCAVTRTDLKGSVPAYLSEEAFTVQEALDSFTSGSAYASFDEMKKGTIQPGMLADFVVLDRNPFLENTSDIRRISVKETFLGGKSVYTKS